jgi:hypothetical protein
MTRKCGVGAADLVKITSDTPLFYDKSAEVEEKKGVNGQRMSVE